MCLFVSFSTPLKWRLLVGEAQVTPTSVFIQHRLDKQEVQYIGRKGNFVTGQWKLGIALLRVTRSCCPTGHLPGVPSCPNSSPTHNPKSLPPDEKGGEPLTCRTDPSIFEDRPNKGRCFFQAPYRPQDPLPRSGFAQDKDRPFHLYLGKCTTAWSLCFVFKILLR